MGGFSYDEYTAQGITVSNAPTFAGSLVYDPINFGNSRPFFEIGGGVVPFEQVRYERTYPYGGLVAEGQGNAINRSLGLFARVGWVDRVTPIDEAAVYTDISRSWLTAGGYTEASAGNNPYPATVSTGLEALDVLRFGGQYTHLFGGQFEANVSAAVAYGFNSTQQRAMECRRLRPDRALPDRQFGLVRMGRPRRLSGQPAHGRRRLPARHARRPGRHDDPRRHRPALSLLSGRRRASISRRARSSAPSFPGSVSASSAAKRLTLVVVEPANLGRRERAPPPRRVARAAANLRAR